jgi:hypothetical protein
MVANITVGGGATVRGVGIGAMLADIKAAYPKAVVDHSTDETFQLTLVKIPRGAGGRLQFAIDTTTKKVSLIGIPYIAFCEWGRGAQAPSSEDGVTARSARSARSVH